MSSQREAVAAIRPPWPYLPLELRALPERLGPLLARRWQKRWPRGRGEPVMVIPGFGQQPSTTQPLRHFLDAQGYVAHDWNQGRNRGLGRALRDRLLERCERLSDKFGEPLRIVGWSLGGIYARELARQAPDRICHVVTLGSPLAGPQTTTITGVFQRINPGPLPSLDDRLRRLEPPPVRCTAIVSRSDGIVAWRAALEPPSANGENILVRGSHMALGFNPLVWYAITHRLSPQTGSEPFAWPDELRAWAPQPLA